MDKYDKELIATMAGIILGAIILMFVVCFTVYKISMISQSNIVKVYIGEKIIYEGKKVFISIDSGGSSTTITIYKKLFPIPIIDKVYSDKTIRVEAIE